MARAPISNLMIGVTKGLAIATIERSWKTSPFPPLFEKFRHILQGAVNKRLVGITSYSLCHQRTSGPRVEISNLELIITPRTLALS
jgi:hypothetical protein